jgi:hypothetical protein
MGKGMKSNRKGNERERRKSFTPFCEEEGKVFKGKRGMGEDGRVGKGREGRERTKGKWKGRGRERVGKWNRRESRKEM